ncbi:MAG: shikimate dehydrogenase, partial [Muribaculaceae bacterium]|nr:shikimate dehydrogenase [Muribaculaceae bacterium]
MRKEYGLIGYPLGHSFSEKYFSEKFCREGLNASYSLYPIESISLLPDLIDKNENLFGLNVTIPYKEKVMNLLNKLSEEAAEIGAVNVIKISRDEKGKKILRGENSDCIGFKNSLKPILNASVR